MKIYFLYNKQTEELAIMMAETEQQAFSTLEDDEDADNLPINRADFEVDSCDEGEVYRVDLEQIGLKGW